MLTEKETQDLLSNLCVTLGFCDADASFFELKLETVDDFTKAVIAADGDDLDDRSDLYKQVRQMVHDAFDEHFDVEEMRAMLTASEASLAEVWDNPEDDVYTELLSK